MTSTRARARVRGGGKLSRDLEEVPQNSGRVLQRSPRRLLVDVGCLRSYGLKHADRVLVVRAYRIGHPLVRHVRKPGAPPRADLYAATFLPLGVAHERVVDDGMPEIEPLASPPAHRAHALGHDRILRPSRGTPVTIESAKEPRSAIAGSRRHERSRSTPAAKGPATRPSTAATWRSKGGELRCVRSIFTSRSSSRRCRGPRPRCPPLSRCSLRQRERVRRWLRFVGCSWCSRTGRESLKLRTAAPMEWRWD